MAMIELKETFSATSESGLELQTLILETLEMCIDRTDELWSVPEM